MNQWYVIFFSSIIANFSSRESGTMSLMSVCMTLTFCKVIIIGSHHDKSALLFWSMARRLPIQENPVTAWKFCHVVHKLLRDGHHTVSICS